MTTTKPNLPQNDSDSQPRRDSEPSDERDGAATGSDKLPDLRDYVNMDIEQLNEEKLRVPYWRMKKQITDEQASERIAIIAAVRAVLLSEKEVRDAQYLFGKNAVYLGSLLHNLIPAQPTPPAVPVGDLDDLTRAEMQADATPPAAAPAKGGKLTARNNHVLRNVKRMYNRSIYTLFSSLANKYTVEGAIKWLLETYVRPESRDEVRAKLTAQDGQS